MRFVSKSALLVALALLSCVRTSITGSYVLSGTVRDEQGVPIAGAQIQLQSTSQTVTADKNGHFSIASSAVTDKAVLSFTAKGYAPRSVPMNLSPKYPQVATTTTLRAIDKLVHVTLPSDPNVPLVLSVAKDDGQVTLSIPANSMVLPNGALATGDANVALTYWHPNKDVQSAPGPLLTPDPNNPNTPHMLRTYGMAAIEVSQDGNLLQVAAGKKLPLAFTLPVNLRGMIGDAHRALPDLYYFDHTAGLWQNQGSLASGALAWNPNAGIMTAQLPHLSEWNIDGFDQFTSACFKGTVINKCTGKPLANADLSIWFMAWEELSVYPEHTDADGKWCHTHFTPDIIANYHPSNLTQIYVSGGNPTQVTNSSLCQPTPGGPIPSECVGCASIGVASQCCRYQMDYQVGSANWFDNQDYFLVDHPQGTCLGYYGVPEAECRSTCSAIDHIVDLRPCHVCPGHVSPSFGDECWGEINAAGNSVMIQHYDNNCIDYDALWGGPIEVSDGTCKLGDPNTPAVTGPANPCPVILQEGQPCEKSSCCAPGLICNDFVCVPSQEPH